MSRAVVVAKEPPQDRRAVAGDGEREAIRDRPTTRLVKAERSPLCEGATSRTQAATPEGFRRAGDFATDAAAHLGGLGPVEYHQSATSPRTTPAHRPNAAGAARHNRRIGRSKRCHNNDIHRPPTSASARPLRGARSDHGRELLTSNSDDEIKLGAI